MSRCCRWTSHEVELSDEDQAFQDELRTFLATIVTDDVIAPRSGDGRELRRRSCIWRSVPRDIWTRLHGRSRRRLQRGAPPHLGTGDRPGAHAVVPLGHNGHGRQAPWSSSGRAELKDEVLPKCCRASYRLCLGYTEPEGGSDIATCKTRAVRDGDGWIINGSKMFTSNAHNAQYVFLITNTDPDAPKHQSLTMFLVPLDTPGVEIQPIRTVDGDRTNITYYSDVRIDDKYRWATSTAAGRCCGRRSTPSTARSSATPTACRRSRP